MCNLPTFLPAFTFLPSLLPSSLLSSFFPSPSLFPSNPHCTRFFPSYFLHSLLPSVLTLRMYLLQFPFFCPPSLLTYCFPLFLLAHFPASLMSFLNYCLISSLTTFLNTFFLPFVIILAFLSTYLNCSPSFSPSCPPPFLPAFLVLPFVPFIPSIFSSLSPCLPLPLAFLPSFFSPFPLPYVQLTS